MTKFSKNDALAIEAILLYGILFLFFMCAIVLFGIKLGEMIFG